MTVDEWTPLQLAAAEEGGWYLYRFFTRQPCAVAGCTIRHPLYIGKSNDPLRRWLEHAPKQPWWSAQCGYEIDERVWPSDRAVRAAETAAIRAELPLANEAGNERNVHRLDFGQATPRPVRARASRPAKRTVAPVRGRRDGLSRAQRHAIGVLFVWGALSALLWFGGLRVGLGGSRAALDAAVGAALLMLGGWAAWHAYRSARPRMRRRAKAWAAVAVLIAVVYVVWPLLGVHLPAVPAATPR